MRKLIILLFAVMMLLPGCTKRSAESAAPSAEQSSAVSEAPEPSSEAEPLRHPLTGEEVDEELTARPFAIMINNHELAQPQCGIASADMIYEILAEGGLTRMMLIVTDPDSAERFGTMRSLRPYYLEVGLSYGAVIVHAGGSEQAYSDVTTKGADNLDGVRGKGAGSYYYRDKSRISNGLEHSLFISSESLIKYAQERGVAITNDKSYDFGLSFTEDAAPSDGKGAEKIDLTFGTWKESHFTYSVSDNAYYMSQYGSDYKDGDTGENVGFTNLLILEAPTRTLDSYGRLEVNLVGEGDGYFINGGKYIPIIWHRDANGEQFYYTLVDGSDLIIGVGKSYVGVVPTDNYKLNVQ